MGGSVKHWTAFPSEMQSLSRVRIMPPGPALPFSAYGAERRRSSV